MVEMAGRLQQALPTMAKKAGEQTIVAMPASSIEAWGAQTRGSTVWHDS